MKRIYLFLLAACLSIGLKSQAERYPVLFNMVHHNPGEPKFNSRFVSPEYLGELGYKGQVPKVEIQCGITYDSWQPGLIPVRSEERFWIDRHAADVHIQLQRAKDAGVEVYPFTDILVVPKILMDKYHDEMVDENGKISILRPRTQEVVRAQISEIFDTFSELDGLTFRHGETYLHDTPYHVGGSPARTPEEHSKLINLLREEICVKRGKKVFYRTWDFERLHSKPDLYLATMSQVQPHENLFIMIKHVNYDFNRGYPFNKTIGLGNIQQIVEVSVNQAGCYGKNAHPYYIGKGVIDGWNDMDLEERRGIRSLYDDPLIKGFWIWTWGDSWYGPYFSNELWVKLNEYVLRTFVKEPLRSEESIFMGYAIQHLGLDETDARKLREICLLSEDAVFYGQDSKIFKVGVWWCRDQYFTCVDLRKAAQHGVVQKLIAEKDENLKRWYRMEKLSRQITMPNAEDQTFLQVSITYGRIKYELIDIIWKVQALLAENEVNGKSIDPHEAKFLLDAYDEKWSEWETLKRENPCCPTLYEDWRAVNVSHPFQESVQFLKQLLDNQY